MELSLEQFQKIKTIKKGKSALVELCFWRDKNIYIALKTIPYKDQSVQNHQLTHYARIIKLIKGPGVATLYGTFHDKQNVYIVMEYISGGDLLSYLKFMHRFDRETSRFYAAETLVIIEILHRNHILYSNLKLSNLLLDKDGHIKFVDFSFSRFVKCPTFHICGSPQHLAPEVIKGEGASLYSDWWSFGVLIYEMLVGKTPFFDPCESLQFENICSRNIYFPESCFDPLSRDLVDKLLQVELTKRIGCSRADAQEIKQHPWFQGIDWAKVYFHIYKAPIIPELQEKIDEITI